MKIPALCILPFLFYLASCQPDSSSPAPGKPSETKLNSLDISGEAQKELGITVEKAAELPLGAPLAATGLLQVNDDAQWQVGALTDGKIISVPVRVGDSVRSGQIMAVLHSHEVHDARATYRQAVAELERQRTLAKQALTVRDRTRRLFDLRAASREQLDTAETLYRSATTIVSNAEAEVQKAEFHLTDFLEVPVEADADHDSIQNSLTIKAPASGTLMQRNVSAGSVVSMGTPVFSIADLTTLWMIAAVNEADLSRVRAGQQVEITVRAFPDRVFPGRVLKLGERLDPQTRTLQVRVLVPNRGGLLKPDMFATASFTTGSSRAVIQIPESAVQSLHGKTVVFVQAANGSFIRRDVTAGARVGGRVEIVSGLSAGDNVVVNGAFLLRSQIQKQAAE